MTASRRFKNRGALNIVGRERRDFTSEKGELVDSIRSQLQVEAKKQYFPGMFGSLNIDSRSLDGFRTWACQIGAEYGQCGKGVKRLLEE